MNQLPEEIKIYYSRWGNLFLTLLFGITSFANFYFLRNINSILISLLSILLGCFSINYFFKLLDRNPQLIINKKGIKPIDRNLITWGTIHSAQIKKISGAKSINYYLDIYSKNKHAKGKLLERINFTELGITGSKLETIIAHYKK